uniref:DNA-directed DNA polymerase n=2 Tax=Globodera rostochiensis TaxID=31243 RepID=A0A914GTD6_GLORO
MHQLREDVHLPVVVVRPAYSCCAGDNECIVRAVYAIDSCYITSSVDMITALPVVWALRLTAVVDCAQLKEKRWCWWRCHRVTPQGKFGRHMTPLMFTFSPKQIFANNNNNNNNKNGPSPAKRQRRDVATVTKYIRTLDAETAFNPKFKLQSVRSSFLIEQLPANPESMLHALFDHCVRSAIKQSRQNGIAVDRLGATVSSSLLNPNIWIPVRSITPNTVSTILNRFLDVAQSKSRESSLLGEPFTVTITALEAGALPKQQQQQQQQQQIRGRGRRTPRHVQHIVREIALLQVHNRDDAYCLFYALEISRIYHSEEMARRNFSNYLNRQFDRQQRDVLRLMNDVQIPLDRADYDAVVYVPRVVDFWNVRHAAANQRYKVYIFGANGRYKPMYKYGPDDFTVPIALYYNDGHFDGIRCGVGRAVFGRDLYCFACECPYDNASLHTAQCAARCINCGRVGVGRPCKSLAPSSSASDVAMHCAGCAKTFATEDCYVHHTTSGYCDKSKKCEKCGVIWNVRDNTREGRAGHVCEERYCRVCKTFHNPKRGCYIQRLKPRRSAAYRLIAFDCETTQCRQVDTTTTTTTNGRAHDVNFISAHVTCTTCIADNVWRHSLLDRPQCRICGPFRTVTFSHCPFRNGGGDDVSGGREGGGGGGLNVDSQRITQHPMTDFSIWLMHGFDNNNNNNNNKNNKQYPTVVFAHFGGRFDNVMLFRQFFLHGVCPQLIARGNKLYEMRIPKSERNGEIIIRDSWNLMPVPLGALPSAFGLAVQDKEFFPHLANVPANYGCVLSTLPPKSDYLYGGMTPERQRKFDAWYDTHRKEQFDLCEQLAVYCTNDTHILIEALIAFRSEFLDVTDPDQLHGIWDDDEDDGGAPTNAGVEDGKNNNNNNNNNNTNDDDNNEAMEVVCGGGGIDITWEPLTIASASMKHFRLNHLRTDQLAIVPDQGYDTANNQSRLAMKFLDWYGAEHSANIQTAHSPGGEHRVGPYTVDGYIAASDTVIEVNGCHWHAHDHPQHRFHPQLVMSSGKTAARIREDDARRMEFIRTQVRNVQVFWECEIEQMRRRDPDMQRAFYEHRDRGPIKIRDCYHGGRVGPLRLHYQVPAGWKMKYLDVRSLYPYTNAVSAYPTGHPSRVNVLQGADSVVDWRRPEQVPVRGILKVFVVPPRRVDVPVLPVKFDERLLFPLCRTCALQHTRGAVQSDYRCQHSDDERGWVATVTSIELEEALSNNYRCTAYYRSIEWSEDQWNERVFRAYVAEFMSMKTHASGFPEEVRTAAERERFVDECWERFGMIVDPARMEHNKAKRTIAKLCNNSLWGRFSLRNGLSKSQVTDSPAELRRLLDNPRIEVSSIDQLSDEAVLVTYSTLTEWIEEHGCSNIVVSLWTTSAARLHLLRLMQAVARAPNAELIYTDTDSVCFAYKETDGCPLQIGPHLGDLSDEWPEHELLEFVSGGCKQYALRMRNLSTGEEHTVLKVRGITLSGDACKKLHFDTFKRSVLRYGRQWREEDETDGDDDDKNDDDEVILLDYPNFLRPDLRSGTVHSVALTKRYCPIVTKGVVSPSDLCVRDFGHVQ